MWVIIRRGAGNLRVATDRTGPRCPADAIARKGSSVTLKLINIGIGPKNKPILTKNHTGCGIGQRRLQHVVFEAAAESFDY